MMLFALYDRKLREIGAIVQSKNNDMIERSLAELLASENMVSKHPEDYDLLYLGTVNVETGVILPAEVERVYGIDHLISKLNGGADAYGSDAEN